jgi:hypothetical protein
MNFDIRLLSATHTHSWDDKEDFLKIRPTQSSLVKPGLGVSLTHRQWEINRGKMIRCRQSQRPEEKEM